MNKPKTYPKKRRNWPFKFYELNGKMYQNTVPLKPRPDVGEAKW